MSVIVLDAGALIALERQDRRLWAVLKLAALQRDEVCVPSAVVAQVWRGRARQALLAKALQNCVIAPFDPNARAIGELCGRARTDDVCDGHVALIAGKRGDALYTSDTADLSRLIAAVGPRRPVIVPC